MLVCFFQIDSSFLEIPLTAETLTILFYCAYMIYLLSHSRIFLKDIWNNYSICTKGAREVIFQNHNHQVPIFFTSLSLNREPRESVCYFMSPMTTLWSQPKLQSVLTGLCSPLRCRAVEGLTHIHGSHCSWRRCTNNKFP